MDGTPAVLWGQRVSQGFTTARVPNRTRPHQLHGLPFHENAGPARPCDWYAAIGAPLTTEPVWIERGGREWRNGGQDPTIRKVKSERPVVQTSLGALRRKHM